MPELQPVIWWVRGERPLRMVPPQPVGAVIRPWATAAVYRVTRRVTGPGGVWGWGRATGAYEPGLAAREYAQSVLTRRPQPPHPLPLPRAWWLLRQGQRRFGLAEAAAAAAVAAALHADRMNWPGGVPVHPPE